MPRADDKIDTDGASGATQRRVEPFTTSILDGIDLRETIRKWYEKRIYVRHFQKIHGEVGSVVVIFDEDRDNRYSYMTTWLGENQNESDMAFYSTFPFDNLVGPGIGRGEYGGFLMSLPPAACMTSGRTRTTSSLNPNPNAC